MDGTIDPATQLPEHDPAPDDAGAPSDADLTAILDWTEAALRGEAVPDHALQFEAVDQAAALRAERDALRMDMREIVAELDKHQAPADQRPQARIRMWARAILEAQELADAAAVQAIARARAGGRRRMPDCRDSKTHKFSVGGQEGYITVGFYEDGMPGEIFLRMGSGRDLSPQDVAALISGLSDCFATAVSIALQHGAPLANLVEKFARTKFEPAGATGNADIPRASSLADYWFRWLQARLLPAAEIADPAQVEIKP